MALPATGIITPCVFVPNDIDYSALWVALFNSSWSPTVTAAVGYTATNEVTGAGYTAGGKALTGVTVTRSATEFKIVADDPAWASATLTDVAVVAFYDPAATSPVADAIVAVHKVSSVGANSGGTFTHDLPSGVVLRVANPGG